MHNISMLSTTKVGYVYFHDRLLCCFHMHLLLVILQVLTNYLQ